MEYTKELRKFVAPEIITGVDSRLMIDRYIYHFGSKKPMIVTDSNLVSLDWFWDIIDKVKTVVNDYVIYDQVTSNPRDYEVMNGAKIFLEEKCDIILAIGGGSPIDCAKGISIVSTNGGNILDYEGVDEITLPGPPMICIPTTSGASADVSQFAIILDSNTKVKKAIISKKIVPDLALLDAVPLTTMDANLTACTGMDALTHAIEAYVSNANSPLSNVHALEAIYLINANIQQSILPERSIDNLFRMMLGSLHAGLAFSNASLGLVHAMAHSLGGFLDLPHGECNSILLEHVINLNFNSVPNRYRYIAKKMKLPVEGFSDTEIKIMLTNHISDIRESLSISPNVFADNLDNDLFENLSIGALNDPCILTNPRNIEKEDIITILRHIIRQR